MRPVQVLSIALLSCCGLATSASANTLTFSLTTDFCSGTCGTAPFGTVTATDIGAGEVQVTVMLKAGESFAKTGAGGGQAVLWNLAGTPTLTDYTDVSSNQPIVLASTTAGSIGGPIQFQYAVNCPTCGNGTSPPQLLSPITFDISSTGLSTASFTKNGAGLFFAADILGTNGNTGIVGAPTVTTPTPIPAALPLFAGGLGVLGLLGWRRKRKAAAAA